MTHKRGKSDSAIIAEKPTNNAGQPAEELVERRAEAEGNAEQQSTRRAQDRVSVSHALDRIRRVARQRKKEKFTALLQHIGAEHLEEAFFDLKENAAPGVDGLTWRAYETGLGHNIADLHSWLQRGAYWALPSRKAGVLENGVVTISERGTGQGSVISPLLAMGRALASARGVGRISLLISLSVPHAVSTGFSLQCEAPTA